MQERGGGGCGPRSILQRKKAQPRLVAFDGDQRAALEFFGLLFQDEQDVFTNAGGADVVKPELDDAGQRRAALKQELGEIEVLGKNDGAVLSGPPHDRGIRGVGWPQFAPVTRRMAVPAKKLHPRKRQAVVNDEGHAG